MEVEHFPPATIKPPVKWEINLDDDGAIIDDSKEKEEEPQLSPEEEAALLEREREEELRVEKERLEQLQTQFPPVNPEDPYAHPETRDSFLQFHPLCTMQESHPIRTVSFSPYGEAFCVGTNSKALRICKLAPDGDAIEVLHERANHHKGSVYCSSWNCESRLVATGSNDKTVKVVKVFLEDEGTGAGIVSNSIEQVRAREARPPCDPLSSQTVISSHRRAILFTLARPQLLTRSAPQNDLVLKGHGGTVRDVQFHKEDSNRLLSVGAHDNLCLVWDIVGTAADNVEPIRSLSDHTETVFCGRFNPFDTNLVATGGADNTVKIWDLRSLDFTQSSTTANTPSAVLSLLWSDRHTVVTSHADGSIRETDVRARASRRGSCCPLTITFCAGSDGAGEERHPGPPGRVPQPGRDAVREVPVHRRLRRAVEHLLHGRRGARLHRVAQDEERGPDSQRQVPAKGGAGGAGGWRGLLGHVLGSSAKAARLAPLLTRTPFWLH